MFMEFPGVFALKENLTCSVYMSTAGVKGRGGGGLQPRHTEPQESAAGEEREKATGAT